MKHLKEKIKELASEYHDEAIEIRRHLHMHPELSFKEYKTSEYIQQKLLEYGISFNSNIVETGVVALIEGINPSSKCIALRADIDALPIKEQNDIDYCSKNDGIMHACGHDVHTSSLLIVAKILNELKDQWEGSIKFIFQPGEEQLPGGASLMISEGVLSNPTVHKIIGQHVSPELSSGKIGMKPGMFMASTDEVYIDVYGKGGHAAIPEDNINPIILASNIISSLYARFEAEKDKPTVFSIGAIQGGSAGNIVPEIVHLKGTFRAMDEKWRKEAHIIMNEICSQEANLMGGQCVLDIKVGYPYLENNEELTTKCMSLASDYVGEKNLLEIPKRMTAEDFSYYSHHVPSCFYRLGVGFDNQQPKRLHSPNFNIDENALKTSVGLMVWLAINA